MAHIAFCCLKTRQLIKGTWLGTLMWLDFVARTVCWICVYIMGTSTKYILHNTKFKELSNDVTKKHEEKNQILLRQCLKSIKL